MEKTPEGRELGDVGEPIEGKDLKANKSRDLNKVRQPTHLIDHEAA